jgi:hypothetical protein
MAATIPQVYVDGFRDALRHLAQQKTSKLRAWCDEFSPEAETGNWDRLAKAEANAKTRRTTETAATLSGLETPIDDRVWSRRIAVAGTYNGGEWTEVEDPSMMLIDPNSNLVQSLGYAMGRKFDDIILTAAFGNALNSVRAGDGSNTPTPDAVPVEQVVGDWTTPISFDAITEVLEIFNRNDIDMDEPKVAVIGPRQVRELMNLTEQTSADYVQARALQQNGIVPNWMGFTWIMSTRLYFNAPVPAATEQSCLFMTRRAMGLHVAEDIKTFVERDPSYQYAWRPYCQFTAGSVRVEDEHMVWGKFLDASVPAP